MTPSSVNTTLLSNARAEGYHSRNLVTERDVIGLYDLIVERDERVAVYIHLSFQRYSL